MITPRVLLVRHVISHDFNYAGGADDNHVRKD
jgi:hypothetical protein